MIDIVEELKAEASYHYTDLFQRAADEIMMLRKSLHDIAAVTFCPKCHGKRDEGDASTLPASNRASHYS